MEEIFVNIGMTYTWAKICPYVLSVLLGVFGFVTVRKVTSKYRFSYLISAVVLLLPFGIYFSINPIYRGDFSSEGKTIHVRSAKTTSFNNGLLVLAQPGCPYCYESIFMLNDVKEKYPQLNIEFCLIGTNDIRNSEAISSVLRKDIPVTMERGGKALETESIASFPTYVIVKDGVAVEAFSNDEFGVRVKDKIVELFAKAS
jgi:thiol-disulfide isomerase/thioredoxin